MLSSGGSESPRARGLGRKDGGGKDREYPDFQIVTIKTIKQDRKVGHSKNCQRSHLQGAALN